MVATAATGCYRTGFSRPLVSRFGPVYGMMIYALNWQKLTKQQIKRLKEGRHGQNS